MNPLSKPDPLGFVNRSVSGAEYASADAAAYEALVELVKTGDAIAFVGAGVSVPAGLPTWRSLLTLLSEAAAAHDGSAMTPVPESRDWLPFADDLRARLSSPGPEAFENYLAATFNKVPHVVDVPRYKYLRPLHRKLVQLPFAGWTTTNYDHVLEHAISDAFASESGAAPEPNPVCIYQGYLPHLSDAIRGMTRPRELPLRSIPPRTVLHWHGTYGSAATVILGARDYASAYGFRDLVQSPEDRGAAGRAAPVTSRLFTAMAALLTTRQLVFWGFSLDDPYVEHVLERTAAVLWDWGRSVHFAVSPLFVGDADLEKRQREVAEERLGKLGIRTVWYPVLEHDYSALEDVVDRLANDIAPPITGDPALPRGAEAPPAPADAVGESKARATDEQSAPAWLHRAAEKFVEKGPRNAD